MDSTDLRSSLSLGSTPPEEAAHNIDRAKLAEINPDAYPEIKSVLEPKISAYERVPANVEPATQDFAKQSKQHLSLIQDDISKLSDTEKRLKFYKQKFFDEPDLRRQRNELAREKLQTPDGVLSEEKEQLLQDYNAGLAEMGKQDYDLAPGTFEKWAVDVGAAGVDIARSYWENKELVGASVGVTGLLGAVGGFLGTFGNPLGALAGAKIGAGPGAAFAAVAVPTLDAYVQTRDSLYNDLSYGVDDNGQPLNIPHERRVLVSQGVSVISAAAAGYAGKVFASNNPYLRKFMDPTSAARYVISNPALMAKMDLLGGVLKSGFGEGFEEGVQSLAEKVGTELGKVDGSEESFMNALDNILSMDTLKDAAYSASVGLGAGVSFATATNAPMYKKVKTEYQNIQRESLKKREVLETQNMMMEANAVLQDTKLQKLAPDESRSFKQMLFNKLGFDEGAWFSAEDLQKFADTPDKMQKIKNLVELNPELVKLAKETNSNIQLSKADVLDIMTEFPDISNFMRLSPEGQSPFEVREEAKNFVENLSKADVKRNQIMEGLGIVDKTEISKEITAEALGDLKDSPYFSNEAEYLDRAPMKEMEGFISTKEAEEFNTAHLNARLAVAESLKEDVDAEFRRKENEVIKQTGDLDKLTVQQNGQEVEIDFEQVEKDLEIVDRFRAKANNEFTKQLKEAHTELGNFSTFAIDPRFLPDDIRPALTGNEMLSKRKVFATGGLSPDEAAVFLGVESGDKLIKILANTPDRKTLQKRKQQRKIELRNQVEQGFKQDKLQARDDAFTNLTKIHLREMEFMRTKEWPTTKRGIIKIARKVPTIESINAKALDAVNGMKIKSINPNQFKQGENRSQQMAVKSFLNAEFEQAFAHKEKAALNSELMKEAFKAKTKVAKAQKFWKRVASPSNVQMLKDAGYFDVMNDYMTLYRLDGNTSGSAEAEQKSFNKWIKRQVAEGKYVPHIPERLNNTQVSYKDLTVEQYQTITEMGQYILEQAKLKNVLLAGQKARAEFRTAEIIAENIKNLAEAHPDYDVTRGQREEVSTKNGDFITNVQNGVKTLISSVNNTKNIVMELDNHQVNGFFYNTFVDPLVRAQTAKRQEISDQVAYTKQVIERFFGSEKKYNEMVNTRLNIPEFANISTLNNGQVRKIDLMRLMAFMGDPDGRKHVENFEDSNGAPLTFDAVMRVLDRELTETDAAFVQNFFVNPFKRFERSYAEMHKRTTGIDPEMVTGVSYVHRGKVYEGGYQPLIYQRLSDAERAAQEVDEMTNAEGNFDEGAFFARMRAAEMTKQDRMKSRTGSRRALKLDFEDHFQALEDVIHDVHFREVGIDLMKIMKQPHNVQNMKSVIGAKKFVLMLDSIKDVVSKTSDKNSILFREQESKFQQALGFFKSLHALKSIGFNVMSAAIQWDSLLYMPLRSGPKTMIYLAKTAKKMSSNLSPANYKQMIDIASEILPDIKFEQDAIDDSIIKSSETFIPHGNTFFKNYEKLGSTVTRLRQLRKNAIDNSYFLLRAADKFNKVFAVHALAEQFLNGDIEGYDAAKVNAMSDTEKKATMQKVIKQIVDTSLTASSRLDKTALEKSKLAPILVNYWTDRRSRLNSITSQANKIRKSVKGGDYRQAASQIALLAFVSGMSVAFQQVIRDDEESALKKLKEVSSPDDALNFATDTAFDFALAPATQLAQSIPGVDAMLYAYEGTRKFSKTRPVSIPLLGVATDIVTGVSTLADLMESGLDMEGMSRKDRKAVLTLGGYMIGGAPTNTINKILDEVEDKTLIRKGEDLIQDFRRFNDLNQIYNEKFKDDPEKQTFIQDLNEFQKTLPQLDSDVTHQMPENTKDEMKQALSGGDWTKFNEDTGAVGVYQFTEDRWNEIMLSYPEEGFTENGRLAKDSKQQERAMELELQDNTKTFMAYEIPVTKANLMGAHQFGVDNFVSIYEAQDSQKLSEVIGEQANRPEFKGMSTVAEVKKYLSKG
jgi:hypothetical protein